ncbi:MAG: hypothetical protein WC989_05430 [Micavibrio sp.]
MDTQKQQSTINTLYGMLIISTILSFTPFMPMLLLSVALFLSVLVGAYIYRAKDQKDGLLYNHMTYMIGTIWIGTGLITLGTMLAAYWIYTKGDPGALQNAIDSMGSGGMIDETYLEAALTGYMADNKGLLIKASIITIGPGILYFVYRVANGFSRSLKGYRIANPKSWL